MANVQIDPIPRVPHLPPPPPAAGERLFSFSCLAVESIFVVTRQSVSLKWWYNSDSVHIGYAN